MARVKKAQNGDGVLKCATNVGGSGGSAKCKRGPRISNRERKKLDAEYSPANPGWTYPGDRRYTINTRPERTDKEKVGEITARGNASAKKGRKIVKKVTTMKTGGKMKKKK